MLQYNTMRYATDGFSFNKQALLVSKVPFDATEQTNVDGFSVEGLQPAGSARKVMFLVDGQLTRFVDGAPTPATGEVTLDNVLTNGNTAAELLSITDVPAFVGKKIYPVIAMYSPVDAAVIPSIKLGMKVRSANDVYEMNAESAEVALTSGDETPTIADVQAVTTTTGGGNVTVTARVKLNNVWSDWLSLQAVKNRDAQAIQFKMHYTVSQLGGGDSARVDRIIVQYTTGTATVAGDTAEIFSVMRNYEHALQTCAVSVKHKRLYDSKINAFVNFGSPVKRRTFLPIGISTGAIQVLILGENGGRDSGIDQSTIQLFADGKPIVNFNYNTEVSEVTINVPEGRAISATYSYNRSPEIWRQMTIDVDQQPYDDGSYLTRFTYTLPDGELDGQTITNVRLQLARTNGHVDAEILGNATGTTQQFVLAHAAKAETLNVNAQFSYDADSQILTCVAPAGTPLVASYDWIGESHTVYSWAAAWSPAV